MKNTDRWYRIARVKLNYLRKNIKESSNRQLQLIKMLEKDLKQPTRSKHSFRRKKHGGYKYTKKRTPKRSDKSRD